ncbi:MAG: hypothetical protein FJX72_09150 [Armatimonadetes bacterium]|nr:hypothetical protein [Armatimonadota bacterium]
MPRSTRSAILVRAVLGAGLALVCVEGTAQPRAETEPLRAWERREVRRVLTLFATKGQTTPYIAEQTSRLLEDRVSESTQTIKHAGPGRERIEYTSPQRLRGEVILQLGRRLLHYRLRPKPRVVEGDAPDDLQGRRMRELLESVRTGKVAVRHVGRQVVAGRQADIIEIRPSGGAQSPSPERLATGQPFRRLWIDSANGVRMRHESVDPSGTVLSTSYFTRIFLNPTFGASDFRPGALPTSRPALVLPGTTAVANVAEAQRHVVFRIREPRLPPAFGPAGVWLVGEGGARGVVLGYSDGVNTVRLTQRRLPPGAAGARFRATGGKPVMRQGLAHWVSGDVLFTLSGPVRRPMLERIVEGMR